MEPSSSPFIARPRPTSMDKGLDFQRQEDPGLNNDLLANGKIFHIKDVTALTSPRPNHILKAAMLQRSNRDNPFLSMPGKNFSSVSSSLISRMLNTEPKKMDCPDKENVPAQNEKESQNLELVQEPPLEKIKDKEIVQIALPTQNDTISVGLEADDLNGDAIPNMPSKIIDSSSLLTTSEESTKYATVPSCDVTLVEWRLQRVPNDAQACYKIIIDVDHQTFGNRLSFMDYLGGYLTIYYQHQIIGKKVLLNGNLQPWHSSLIASAKNSRTVMTASGKSYYLSGPIDYEGMKNGGWYSDTIELFKEGFPPGVTWIQSLSAELQLEVRKITRQRVSSPPTTKKEKSVQSDRELRINNSKQPQIKKASFKSTLNSLTPKEGLSQLEKKKKNRRFSEPDLVIADMDVPLPSPRHTTRSGRRVYPPLAFWENVYLSSNGQSAIIIQADTPDRLSLSSRLSLQSKSP